MSVMPGEFGADCTEDSQCNSGPCIFRSGTSNGFCTKNCDAVSECPMNYDCTVIGNASRKSCVPEDRLATCKGHCDTFNFFMCIDSTKQAACIQGCNNATVQQRLDFVDCGDPLMCDGEGCLETIAPGNAPWFNTSTCTRTSTNSCPPMDKEYSCPDGEKPDGFMPGMCMFDGQHPQTGEDLYCCFSF